MRSSIPTVYIFSCSPTVWIIQSKTAQRNLAFASKDACCVITACAIAKSRCISDVPSQWENQKFDPPTAPTFSTDLSETQNQEKYSGYDPACKIWLTWDHGKGVCENGEFWLTFGSSFFVLFATRPNHTVGPITNNEGSKRVFLCKKGPFAGLDDKK